MVKILTLSGKKQSGKDTTYDFLKENEEKIGAEIIKVSFARWLKLFLVRVLGLDEKSVNGTDAEKDAPTHLRWENMPGVISQKILNDFLGYDCYDSIEDFVYDNNILVHESGPMSGREVMQYFGTEIVRKMYSEAWVNACFKDINDDLLLNVMFYTNPIYVITDCRFPNEIDFFKNKDGTDSKSIRLLRNKFDDKHLSETALDNYEGFDMFIENSSMSIEEKNDCVLSVLEEWRWI